MSDRRPCRKIEEITCQTGGIHTGNGPQNMAVVKHMALNLLRTAPGRHSLKVRRKKAAWDQDYLQEIVTGTMPMTFARLPCPPHTDPCAIFPHAYARPMSHTTPETLPEPRQVAALCWRPVEAGREVLLITSSHGRWILPKGWPMAGRSDAEAALIEAWEEAGVRGAVVASEPLGWFTVHKQRHGEVLELPARLFAAEVTDLADDWPERDRRERRWLPQDQAAAVVAEDDLRALIRAF